MPDALAPSDAPPPAGDAPGPLAGTRLVLGLTGGIAAYKALTLLRLLGKAGADVQPVLTPDAERFVPRLTVGALAARPVLVDLWPEGSADGRWTQHVDLGVWADAVVIAPATAHTLAKLAHGFCDNLLTAVCLSARCPLVVFPAMDHDMWRHPATQANVATLRGRGATVVEPESGPLASGLVGQGRLPEPEAMLATLAAWWGARGSLAHAGEPAPAPAAANAPSPRAADRGDATTANPAAEATAAEATAKGAAPDPQAGPMARAMHGRRVLVTAGPTREHVDPVRFLSNPSTGTMGFALAAEAARRGAEVTLVAGPVALATPEGVRRVDVVSAEEMHAAVLVEAEAADLVVMTAAVADYAPAERFERKLKKEDGPATLVLRRTPDILAALGAQKRPGQTLVGFAMETHDGEAHARGKLARKRLDAIVLNLLNESGAGFGPGTNRVTVFTADGQRHDLPLADKAAVAARLLDLVAT